MKRFYCDGCGADITDDGPDDGREVKIRLRCMDGETEVVRYCVNPTRHDFCMGCIVEGFGLLKAARPPKKFITVKEAIIRGNVSETTVHRLLRSEEIVSLKDKSGKLHIHRGDFDYCIKLRGYKKP